MAVIAQNAKEHVLVVCEMRNTPDDNDMHMLRTLARCVFRYTILYIVYIYNIYILYLSISKNSQYITTIYLVYQNIMGSIYFVPALYICSHCISTTFTLA